MEKVRLNSAGAEFVGDLYGAGEGERPGVMIIGPMTYRKEQAPTQYARRLGQNGFAALAYDSRYRGESGGEPRAWENPAHKVEDLKAAVDYLRSREEVDPDQVHLPGRLDRLSRGCGVGRREGPRHDRRSLS